MTNNIELLINSPATATLDLTEDVGISLQYSLADIRDISRRNSAYSKTILLPATKNNNYWLGNLFDITADFSQFNPNKKTAAKLLVNSEIVLDGFLQLLKINTLNNTDDKGNLIFYEVALFSNTIDLFSNIGEKTFADISVDEFNHIYNITNIESSWQHTWEDGYVYPMTAIEDTNLGRDYTTFLDSQPRFWPALFYKMVVTKIIEDAGFNWGGSLFDNEQFSKEIIPFFASNIPTISPLELQRRRIDIESTSYNDQTTIPFNLNPATTFYTEVIDTLTIDNVNPIGAYDTATKVWTAPNTGEYSFDFNLNLILQIRNETGGTITTNNNADIEVRAIIQRRPVGGVFSDLDVVSVPNLSPALPTSWPNNQLETRPIVFGNYSTPKFVIQQGDEIRLVVQLRKTGTYTNVVSGNGITLTINYLPARFRNTVYATNFVEGELIDFKQLLSPKLKQKDIILDVIRRYNCYITTDTADNTRVLLDPREDFYDNDLVVDYTTKVDMSSPFDIQLLSELQNKEFLFTYTDDSDDPYLKAYTQATAEVVGQYRYLFDNDFVKGVQEVKSPFSPTAMVRTSWNAIVPAISPVEPTGNPKILIYNGLRNCDTWSLAGLNNVISQYTQYPYAGYYDDPINPTYTLYFANPRFENYPDRETATDNTMYNRFWGSYIRQIESGRLVTLYLNLNENDIAFLKNNFGARIFIKDSYYYLNKIIDYNPLIKGVTKVELLKIVDGVTFIGTSDPIFGSATCPTDIYVDTTGRKDYYKSVSGIAITEDCCDSIGGIWDAASMTCAVDSGLSGGRITPVFGGGGRTAANNNIVNSKTTLFSGRNNIGGGVTKRTDGTYIQNGQVIFGDDNNVITHKSLLLGDRNVIGGESLVLGNDNVLQSGGIVLQGNGNSVEGSNILIGTNNKEVLGTDKVLLGNEFEIEASSGNIVWQGEAITKDVLVNTKKVQVSASEVLELFTNNKLLIESPSPTSLINILSVYVLVDFATASYSADTTLVVKSVGAGSPLFECKNVLAADSSGGFIFTPYSQVNGSGNSNHTPTPELTLGGDIALSTATDDPTNGDSAITVIISYKIVDLAI